jgi:hypothetical protein
MDRLRNGSIVAVFVSLAYPASVHSEAVPEYQVLERGLEYLNEGGTEGPDSIHALRVDRQRSA